MKHMDQPSSGQMNFSTSTHRESLEPADSKPFTLAQIEAIDDRLRKGLPTSSEERQQHAYAQTVIASAVQRLEDRMTAVGHRIHATLSRMTIAHADTVLAYQSLSNLPEGLLSDRAIAMIRNRPAGAATRSRA